MSASSPYLEIRLTARKKEAGHLRPEHLEWEM
jgi:hypothetical protein